MGKLWCFLALLVALPLLIDSQRDDNSRDQEEDEYVHPQKYRPEDIYPDLQGESLPHQVGFIAFPVIVLVLVIVMFIVVFIVIWKNRHGRICCYEKCRSDATRRRQMAMYEAQARAQMRQAEGHLEKKAYEKYLKQEAKERAAAPPSYDTSLSHDVVDDTSPLV